MCNCYASIFWIVLAPVTASNNAIYLQIADLAFQPVMASTSTRQLS